MRDDKAVRLSVKVLTGKAVRLFIVFISQFMLSLITAF